MINKIKSSVLVSLFLGITTSVFSQVKVWEETVIMPTKLIGSPAPHPKFKKNIDMLADDDQIYPYLYNSKITNNYEDKSYIGCYLENEYVKLLVTPEIGGKLYGARDKTNDYNFIYWQPTVKPALIGLTGPWVSGGVEWCFPIGHRATSFGLVGYRIIENADGSKTIWTGETEWMHGQRWIVGVTLHPGKSVVEARVKLLNPTSMPKSQYLWAIAATHADSSYQMIYPTDYMSNHNRFKFTPWPINENSDISWWKNIPNANSYFAEELNDFFGGYSHNDNAGTVFTGNKHIIVGKKFWTWGSSPFGRMWDWILSDGGGPYAEPQAGAFTTNQPDFHWLQPGEVKDISLFIYPVKEIGGFKEANIYGALNLVFDNEKAKIGIYSTSVLEVAQVRLQYKGKVVFDTIISLDPSKVFNYTIPNAKSDLQNYLLTLSDKQGKVLVSYSPEIKTNVELPEPALAYEQPDSSQTNDELWEIGEFVYKNKGINIATKYFNEILKRDSLDVRANLSKAQMEIELSDYAKALKHIKKANVRAKDNGKLFYLKAVALKESGKITDAYNTFYRAVHFQEYLVQSYFEIAQLDIVNGNYWLALEHIDKAIAQNNLNAQLLNLKATAMRKSGKFDAAKETCYKALEIDPLNVWSFYELNSVLQVEDIDNSTNEMYFTRLMLGKTHNYVDLAVTYIKMGLFEEATSILSIGEVLITQEQALINYYKGFCFHKLGNISQAKEEFYKGMSATNDYVLPFRETSINVFNTALEYNIEDANANYYLGLIYFGQSNHINALDYFKKAVELNPKENKAWRNIALLNTGYAGIEENTLLAREYYEKAFELDKTDEVVLYEFDKIKIILNESGKDRLKFLKKHIDVVEQNDDLLTAMLDLAVANYEFDLALKYYKEHVFNNREGRYVIHNSYMNAYIGLAKSARKPEEALEYYKKATLYPDNLKFKPREPNLRGFIYFPMALLYTELGDSLKAKSLIDICLKEHTELPTLVNYYQALAFEFGNDNDSAKLLMEQLNLEADALINGKQKAYERISPEYRLGLGHYYKYLIYEKQGDIEKANTELLKAKDAYQLIERDVVAWAQIKFAGSNQ